ncbi:P-loop containing nucleoside triphosphate hydrolase protein [Helicostylum pulchrum]|nr:P-loop containing nucleoside triphosphate hydrolase protein [Helicostylum pulchrum]
MRTYQYKILVVGDLGTGKTSILRRYVQETFSTHYKSTIGVDFALKVIQHESDIMVHLQLWDIAGQERFGNMTRVYYKGAVGAFVVYDVTRPKTFENVIKWKVDIDSKVQLVDGGGIPTILLANKIDQQENSKSKHELDQFCLDNGFIQWFETSAKENKCITEAANYLINSILELDVTDCSDIDYSSSTISIQSYNKSSKCCS